MEKSELSINYRGFNITHRELHGVDSFHVEGDDWHSDKPTLHKTIEYLDRMLKQKFEKADVIMPRWGYKKEDAELIEGTLTSVTDDGSVWISYKKPHGITRSKISSDVYFDTPENRKLIAEWQSLLHKKEEYAAGINAEIKALKTKISSPIPAKSRKEFEE